MQTHSPRFAATAQAGGKRLASVTCTPPGGDTVSLHWNSASVSCDLTSASRYSAPLRLTPSDKFDVFELVTTPGARFAIDAGFNYGGGVTELLPMGRYELARDSAGLFGTDIAVDLVDDWAKLERDEYDGPFTPAAGLRADIIAAAVLETLPGTQIKVYATGGTYTPTDLSWESRTTLINDLATDGGLDCYFDGAGAFVIRLEPTINLRAPVWTFRSGTASNITEGEREFPFDRLYNRVIVLPMDETQEWAAQVVELTDTDHPLHKSKYGRSTYKHRSPSIGSAAEALSTAMTLLRRVQGRPETVSISSFGMLALESGDTVSIATDDRPYGRGIAAVHLLDGVSFDLDTFGLTAATRSSDATAIDEEAA